MRRTFALFATILLMDVWASILWAADQDAPPDFFRDLAETRGYSLGEPVAPQFLPDGKTILYLRGGARDPVLRLYAFDLGTGEERELITPEQVLGGGEETLSAEEKARRERARVSVRGFTRYELSDDGTRLIVSLSGRLYMLDMDGLRVTELPGENWIDPRLSPDGKFLAAVSGNELHVIDIANKAVKAVTSGATATLHHGVAEFVAQEEMGRFTGYWWSPDGTQLAYQENDESGVEVRYIADPLRPESAPKPFFYPRPGKANTKVRLGVVSRDGGKTQWIAWDSAAYPYLAKVTWDEARGPLTLLVQDRSQQNQLLLAADPVTGRTRTLLREADPAWINLDDSSPSPLWLKDGSSFLWTTERNGQWQVELRSADGAAEHFVTPPDFTYKRLLGADETNGLVYVLGGDDPRETHLWRFPLGGGDGEPLTKEPGVHSAGFSKDYQAYVHRYQLADGRIGTGVIASGRPPVALPSAAETPPALPRVELTHAVGERPLDAAIVRPRDFVSGKKYPVILSVYAGPGVKMVTSAPRAYFTDQWMADQGYVVVRLDGRGTPGYGRDWERAIRGNFIDVALHDQIDGLQALAKIYPEMDMSRVGVTGWSFGGYFSAMAAIRRPDIFRAGVAGAPVVTWENYDTHYTERYLGLPDENSEAYRVSNVTTYAAELSRPLLIIHGLTDDNVYAQHSLQLIDALFMAGKPYEFMPMLGTHMISDPAVRSRQQHRIMDFLARNLQSQTQ